MSKKSKKVAAARAGGRTAVSAPARSSSTRSSGSAGARVYRAAKAEVNLTAVRIAAGVLGALVLIGGIAAGVRAAAPYPTTLIIEMVLLGFLAGLCIYAAIKPETVVGWFKKLG